MKAFIGTLVHTPVASPIDAAGNESGLVSVLEQHCVIIDSKGVIAHIGPASTSQTALQDHRVPNEQCFQLGPRQFLLPGFIDCHIHAPQYTFTGTGTDLPLFDWLNTYTFPSESRLQDLGLAERVYSDVVQRLLSLGTTTAAYFSTLHAGPCKVLADVVERLGQRAFVGKVSMDQHSPDYYIEPTQRGLAAAEEVALYVKGKGCSRLLPCLIPRFIPTCSMEMLEGLGRLAERHQLRIHSHISESREQVEFSHSLHPNCPDDAAIYDSAGLLTPRSFFAHGTQLTESAQQLMVERGAAVAHCPLSNFYFGDGLLDVAVALSRGLTVGLGSDVAGGYSPSMLQSIRMAVVNSHAIKAAVLTPTATAGEVAAVAAKHVLTWQQGLWLATMGGARALGLQSEVGSFEVGKQFDALVVDTGVREVFDVYPQSPSTQALPPPASFNVRSEGLQLVEMFVHLGDDRNIKQVWVQGQQVVGEPAASKVVGLNPGPGPTSSSAP